MSDLISRDHDHGMQQKMGVEMDPRGFNGGSSRVVGSADLSSSLLHCTPPAFMLVWWSVSGLLHFM